MPFNTEKIKSVIGKNFIQCLVSLLGVEVVNCFLDEPMINNRFKFFAIYMLVGTTLALLIDRYAPQDSFWRHKPKLNTKNYGFALQASFLISLLFVTAGETAHYFLGTPHIELRHWLLFVLLFTSAAGSLFESVITFVNEKKLKN